MSSNWKMLGWYVGGVAVATAIMRTTPNPVPFLILGCLIAYFGTRIIDRLAEVPSKSGLQSEWIDEYLTIQTDYLHEEAFKIWFVDGHWEVGRSFEIGGIVVGKPDNPLDGLQIKERTTIRINTLSGWFDKACIGKISTQGRCYIRLPLPLAEQLLNELRRECHQVVSIGFKADRTTQGKPSFPIYLFEVERSLG